MKNTFSIFALVVLFFFCGSILLRYAVKNVLIDKGIENTFTDIVMFDAKENFQQGSNESLFAKAIKEKLDKTAKQKIFEAKNIKYAKFSSYKFIKQKITSYSTDYIIFRKAIVKAGMAIDFSLGNKVLPNNIVDLGEGYLTESLSKDNLYSIDAFVEKTKYFKHILDSLGIPLVYAQYPRVICAEDKISKTGKDQSVQAKKELMQKLRDINIPVIDLQKHCRHSMFYKTDHHWRIKTSIWAAQMISKELNELYGFNLQTELLDTNNFTEKFATKWMGSMGAKVIPLYPKEDFYIYTPKYKTNINWLLCKDSLYQSNGSFNSLYHFISDYTAENKGAYETAYPSLSFSRNNDLLGGKKILLIGDSNNDPMSKFLALVFKEVNFIQRHSSLLDDYLANKPDVVVIGFSNSAFAESLERLVY